MILLGNISELVPNLMVTAETEGGETLEYAPSLSMKDGNLAPCSGVYDCSDYEHIDPFHSGPCA